jgi:hypothetical protein
MNNCGLVSYELNELERFILAENKETSAELLVQLGSDKDLCVRLLVARNPNTPAEALVRLSKLSKESDWSKESNLITLAFVIKNPNTPPDIAKKLNKKISPFFFIPMTIKNKEQNNE